MTDANNTDEFSKPFCEAFVDGTDDERNLLRILHQLSIDHICKQPRNGQSMLRSVPLSNLRRQTQKELRFLKRMVRAEARFWGIGAFCVDENKAKMHRKNVIDACNDVSLTIPIHKKRVAAKQAWSERVAQLSESAGEGIQRYMLGDARDALKDVVRNMCLQMGVDPQPMQERIDQEFDAMYKHVKCSANNTAVKAYRWISAIAAGIEPSSPPSEEEKAAA